MLNPASCRMLFAALLASLTLNVAPVAYAADSDEDKTEAAVEDAVEKEKQREQQGSDKNDVGETEFSAQDCADLNKTHDAGGEVSQKDLDACDIENTE